MKKNFILRSIIAVGLALSVSSCGEDIPSYKMNEAEVALIKQCQALLKDFTPYCEDYYSGTYNAMQKARNNNRGYVSPPNDKPFSDVIEIFQIEDKIFKKSLEEMYSRSSAAGSRKPKTLEEVWYGLTGKYIYSETKLPEQSSGDFKQVDEKYVLSPALYDNLIDSVKTCNRATFSSMDFQMGSTLNKDQYNKVMTIILDCKKFQLEQAIQSK